MCCSPSAQSLFCPLHGPLPTLSSRTSALLLCRSSRSWGPSALLPNCSTSCRCPAAALQSAVWVAMHTPRALQPEAAPRPGAILCHKDSASRWLCRTGMGPEPGSCTVPVPLLPQALVFPGPVSPGPEMFCSWRPCGCAPPQLQRLHRDASPQGELEQTRLAFPALP